MCLADSERKRLKQSPVQHGHCPTEKSEERMKVRKLPADGTRHSESNKL
jgi:hypothetical protein